MTVPLDAGSTAHRRQRTAAVLGLFQQRAQAYSERRMGAPGHAKRLRDLGRYLGVNMRLAQYGIRELHWHQQAEWAIMVEGTCRVTTLDEEGRPQVAEVQNGDLWYFPAGLPHSLQGLGSTGAEFVLAFDNGKAAEFNTLMVTDWFAHTPPEVLALNFGVPADAFKNIPLNQRWIFQGTDPGPLAADQRAVRSAKGAPPHPFVFPLSSMAPTRQSRGGSVHIVDSRNFNVSKTVAMAMVTVKPGAMRELHWASECG
jgi:oxalate decarboxylase